MNQVETEKLLTLIQNYYQNYFKEFSPEAIEIQAKFWQRSLIEYSWAEAISALEIWVNTEIHPPNLAQFKSIIAKIKNPEAFISPERAWEAVNSAVKRFGSYGQEEAFKTFTDPVKRAVRAVGGWQKICQTELGREWDFLKKNFFEAYNEFGQEIKEQELLPPAILNRLLEHQAKLRGPEK